MANENEENVESEETPRQSEPNGFMPSIRTLSSSRLSSHYWAS
jgi:hypothetical protein